MGVGFVTGGGVASTFSGTPEEMSISQSAAMATTGKTKHLNAKVYDRILFHRFKNINENIKLK